jgi:hypothetical protein
MGLSAARLAGASGCREVVLRALSHRRGGETIIQINADDPGFQTRRFLGLLVERRVKVIVCEAAILSCLSRLRRLPIARNGLKHAHAVAFGVKK